MIIDELITDRTYNDVQRWKALRSLGYENMTWEEKSEWNKGMVGAYTPSIDMNRVENAIEYIVERLKSIGIHCDVSTKTDWKLSDIPTPEDLQRYADNVKQIREALSLPNETPGAPDSAEHLTHEQANDIERILLAVDEMIQNIRDTIDLGWALGTSHVGLYAVAPSLRLLTEQMALMVDKWGKAPDLLKLPEGNGQVIIEYEGQNYRCEVQ